MNIKYRASGLTPIFGDIQTMPALPSRPAFMDVDIDTESGEIKGLF
jgi:formyltetrahydrofolate synthetase